MTKTTKDNNKTALEFAIHDKKVAEHKLHELKTSIEFCLAKEVYELFTNIADKECNISSVLGGEPCGKCAVCMIKPLEKKLRSHSIRASWRNQQDDINTLWEALYAIRCITEHTRPKDHRSKLYGDLENIRRTADSAIESIPDLRL